MPFTPVTPTISSVGNTFATITKGSDGNPSGTFYAFQLSYNIGLATHINYLQSDGAFSPTPIWINTTSLTATALVSNTLFSVALAAALDGSGSGATAFGPPATFTTEASIPLFLQFSGVYSTQVTANWQANGNNDQTVYQVQLSTDPSFIFNVIDTGVTVVANSHTFINLLPNTIYYGRVQASSSVGALTGYTNLGSVTTLPGPAPVMGLRSTNLLSNRGFLIQWSANPEPNIYVYRVYRSSSPTDNSSFQVIGTTPNNVTSYVDNVPYSYGITWYYKVTALDNGNNESPLDLTHPVQDMTFSQFTEQPFPTTVTTSDLINQEIPSGSLNGTNTLFTTTYPFKASTLNVYLNGNQLILGVNYTLNIPQQFTLVSPPMSSDNIRVSYLKF